MGDNEKSLGDIDSCIGNARDSGDWCLFFTICSKVGK
jgi:hypothetical protein